VRTIEALSEPNTGFTDGRLGFRSPIVQASLVVTLVVALSLFAAVALTLANFSRALSDTVQSRFAFTVENLRDNIETGLNLGLALDELRNVQRIIDTQLGRDDAIRRIVVSDTNGEAIYTAVADGAEATGRERGRIAAPLVNDFDQEVGRVEIVFAVASYRVAIDRVTGALLRNTAILVVAVGVLAALGCALILRPIPQSLMRIWVWFRCRAVPEPPGNEVEQSAAEAVDASNQVLRELAELGRQVRKVEQEHGGG
jgi:hypothetical protein